MPSPISLEGLQVLAAIAERGSFSAAAEHLYRVPSAITYNVKKLEQDLGVKLFVKQGRRAVLTAAGEVLLTQGRQLLAEAERIAELTRQADSGWESSLRIGIDTVVNPAKLFDVIKVFYQVNPTIKITIYEEVLSGGVDALLHQRLDLMIGASQMKAEQKTLSFAPFATVNWVFAVHPEHVLTDINRVLNKADIAAYRSVVVRDSAIDQAPQTSRVYSDNLQFSVASMQQKIAAQVAGLGVGFLPQSLIEEYLHQGKLVSLPVEGISQQDELYLAWRKNASGKALAWFIEALKNPHS
ncbi:MAG: LysR family transcriptional regulator [Pseudomonadales bacterium]|nr:LysR family transcriptional regulator [Pseudomonadales bacterium]